ncbi:sugar phosphate isomerase/epimerase family protein [Nocardia alni]|uniref:sugar phosphate isomerase/epimerase family protein n=1 Tax=Nocardia alni TaxID=2815723 RepID=UPI001C250FA1|nr:sugar phosphate isomerase/epimerase [Nocardia alni]
MRDNAIEWVLWAGTVGYESPIQARSDAAAANGYSRVSLTPIDVATAEAAGTSARELGRQLHGAGLSIELEGFMTWYPGEYAPEIPLAAFSAPEVLRMAEALQAQTLTALARPTCDLSVDEVAGCFAATCDHAADLGARVGLEFIPFMAVADLPSAAAIVDRADRANGGLVFDTWHFFRGNPDFAALESLSGDKISAVQVSDGGATIQGSLIEDTFQRLFPGDGCFDLVRVLRALDKIGALKSVGTEVISPITAAMPATEAARVGQERTRDLIAQARS